MGRLIYLLNSNVLSEPTRQQPDTQVLTQLATHRFAICTAAPVFHEMRYGLMRWPDGKRKRGLLDYFECVLQPLEVLPYDRESALWHASERARLTGLGLKPPYADG